MNDNNLNVHSDLPATNYFVYGGKRFPFNIFLFNCYSQYFTSNPQIFQQSLDINLTDEFDANTALSEDSITNFINYCQKTDIILHNENVLSIHKLAKKFMVTSLIEITQKYISDHRNDFVIQFLTMNPEEQTSDTEQYEDIISDFLTEYVKDERLVSFPIPFLFRVVTKYQLKNSNQTNTDIMQFLFKCLDKHGKPASVLFQNVDFSNEHIKFLHQLFSDEYSQKFDFHFINTNYHKTIYELHNEIIRKEELIKQQNENIVNLMNEEKEKNRNEMNEMKNQLNEIIANLINKEKEKLNDEMNKFKREQNESTANLISAEREKMNAEIAELKRKQSEELNLLKEEKDRQISEQASYFTKQINDLRDNFNQTLNQQNELIVKLQNEKKDKFTCCPLLNESNLNGINAHLGNSVSLSAGGNHRSSYPLSNITVNNDNQFYNFQKESEPTSENDAWIEFDYGPVVKVCLQSYLIRSNSNPPNTYYHPKSWRIMGSNDKKNWEKLDQRINDSNLNGGSKQHNYQCQETGPDKKYRYIRYIQDDSWENQSKYKIYIKYFELYGSILTDE